MLVFKDEKKRGGKVKRPKKNKEVRPPLFDSKVVKQINEAIQAAFNLGKHVGYCEYREDASIPKRVRVRLRRRTGGKFQVVRRYKSKVKGRRWKIIADNLDEKEAFDILEKELKLKP